MLEGGATHLGVATDHVIESFRNLLWPGYKTGEGMDPLLYAQFQPLEDALGALGVVVWPMVEFEADDALAAAAVMAVADDRVDRVIVCTPDKDLAQCVRGDRIVQLDRRTREMRDESMVRQKFGIPPSSIPDWGARGRQRGWLPWSARLGRQICRDRARPLSAPRADSQAGHEVGRVLARGDAAGRDARGTTRARPALPEACHAAHGRAHRRRRGRAALDGTARGV